MQKPLLYPGFCIYLLEMQCGDIVLALIGGFFALRQKRRTSPPVKDNSSLLRNLNSQWTTALLILNIKFCLKTHISLANREHLMDLLFYVDWKQLFTPDISIL
jgi:hypothetical protein